MSFEKTHDGVMNSVDSTIGFVHKLDWLEYGNSVEYREASQAVYNLFKALEDKTLTVNDDEE